MKKNRLFALIMAMALVMSLAACGAKKVETPAAPAASAPAATSTPAEKTDDTVYTLSWAHSSSTNDRLALATEKMAAELLEASGGRLVIEHYPASQMGGEREILEGITLGTIDCAVISSAITATFAPSAAVASMPYLIDEREVGWKVYDGEFGQMLGKKSEEEGGWKWLGWAENSLRMFSNAKKEIRTPADMVGLKMRVQENDIHMKLVNDLGASATPVSAAELYTALQQGTVDGQENGVALTYALGLGEVVEYMTYLPHIYDPYLVCMSNDAWNRLPADLQKLMEEYGAKYCQYEREFNMQNDEEYLKKMQDDGLQVYYPTDAEKQLFVEATSGVEQLVRDKVGNEIVDSYKAAVAAAKS